MQDFNTASDLDLRIAPRSVLAGSFVLSCLIFLGAQILSLPWSTVEWTMWLLLVVSAVSLVGWLLDSWKPLVSRWFTIVTLSAVCHLAGFWLRNPGSLAWAAIPVVVAVSLISPMAGVATAIGESMFTVFLVSCSATDLEPPDAIAALVTVWAVLGALNAMYRPMQQRIAQLDEGFRRAQYAVEEARDQRVEVKQAVDDLVHANRQLALMNERVAALRLIAEEAQRVKTRFVARVSHEFRTPLNMIIGLVDLMVTAPQLYDVTLSPRMRDDLRTVYRNCEHLGDMVNDVLDLTRMETGCLLLHREWVTVERIIDDAVEVVRPLVESKHLTLHVSVPRDLPEVNCDCTRIKQVLLNLLSNAARYTTKEGAVILAVAQQGQYIRVSTTDTGPGIPQRDIEVIFEPFCQGTSELWSGKGGSGLGLSISKALVELHGGRMWVESEVGVGTTFTFELPISPPVPLVSKRSGTIREEWIWRERHAWPRFSEAHYRPCFIICDATGDLYATLARSSDEVEFVDARDLIQVAKALEQKPAHAIVLNVTDLDEAWHLVEVATGEAEGTPIIACSVPHSAERSRALGALGHLTKPVTRADLTRALQATDRHVRRVLVVDDDPEALDLLSRMLRVCDETLEVTTASDGERALHLLRDAAPDLMLLDIAMPDLDGWQVLEAITRDGEIQKVPTFFVSAHDPTDQPPRSKFLLVTTKGGMPLGKLLRISLEIPKLLLEP